MPTEHTRVQYLLDDIIHHDADLRAALASVRINVDGMRDDFEKSVIFLLPVCPYAKHKMNTNKSKSLSSIAAIKNSKDSRSGIEFRWYDPKEYAKLSSDQRQELYRWQKSKDGKASIKKSRQNNSTSVNFSNKQLQAKIKAFEAEKANAPSVEAMAVSLASAIHLSLKPLAERIRTR